MGKANTEVSYPGTTGGDVCLSKRHIKLHHSLALWELTPKEFIIRVKEEHVVCFVLSCFYTVPSIIMLHMREDDTLKD